MLVRAWQMTPLPHLHPSFPPGAFRPPNGLRHAFPAIDQIQPHVPLISVQYVILICLAMPRAQARHQSMFLQLFAATTSLFAFLCWPDLRHLVGYQCPRRTYSAF